jgi:hypothetical protein
MPIKRPGDGAKVMVFSYSFIVIILCVVIGPCAWLLIAVAILFCYFVLLFCFFCCYFCCIRWDSFFCWSLICDTFFMLRKGLLFFS